MLGQDSLERAVREAGIDAPPVWREETASTNADALELASRGAPEWTVVAAGHQTSGRGRLGRSWADEPGRSLLFSMILRPPLDPARAAVVSLLAAAEMAEACPVPARTKWPNDVVVGNRKLAGILPEARVAGRVLDHLVVGIGVNVGTPEEGFPEEVRATATSLAREGGNEEPEALLARFLVGFRAAYRPIDPDFPTHAVARYGATCDTLGRRVRAVTTDGAAIEGEAVRIAEDGALVVKVGDGERTVGFGEVEHLR
jgi:BirA family biotin operon repressor/biotin-[acetyl-CoA-carboxylase] ligase